MSEVIMIGLDIAKHVFHAHGADEQGRAIFSKRISRGKLLDFFAAQPSCTVALEACGGAHHWARQLTQLGHKVRLIPPAYVKPFVKRQKNDAIDAEAICEAAQRPSMRFVAVKSEQQQAAGLVFRTRDLLVRQRTQLINAIRGHLTEYGWVGGSGCCWSARRNPRGPALSDLTVGDQSRLCDGLRLQQLVSSRLEMVEAEVRAIGDLAGIAVPAAAANPDIPFDRHLRETIGRCGLSRLFSFDGHGQHHHAVRPTGYDHDHQVVEPEGMEAWRAEYRALRPEAQMLAASIIWLYRGRKDNTWLRRVPCTWSAGDAIEQMREQGTLADWASLLVLYPGW